jgi:hypothetical protein
MVYNEYITNYINSYAYNEPIFVKNLKEQVLETIKKNKDQISKNINVILNRLEEKNVIKRYQTENGELKGIYYKPQITKFGETTLDRYKVISYKYLQTEDKKIKGYIYGAKLYNILGLTTQVPNVINIATNDCTNNNIYMDKKLNVIIKKPKIKIDNENCKYLQLLDIIENKDNIEFDVNNANIVLYKYIKEMNFDFEKILLYTYKTKNIKLMEKLYYIIKEGDKR